MDLKKNGRGPSGTVLYNYNAGTDGPHELNGRINSDGSFTLTEGRGVIWRGRFTSPNQVNGVRPNGAANDPQAAQWPFTLTRVETLSAGTILENQAIKPSPKIGIVRSTPSISSGCNCTMQFPADYRAQNQRAIFIDDYEGSAYMNIDGRDVKLKLTTPSHLRKRIKRVGDRSSDVWVADGVRVRVDWIGSKVCKPIELDCEVTWYAATITLTRKGHSAIAKTKGTCGC